MKRTLLSWSSGKDSAWSLKALREDPTIRVEGLFCTINRDIDRVAVHAVRVELLRKQADSAGLPIHLISIPRPCSNAEYEAIMGEFVKCAKARGIECFAFGDLFLEDIREYREKGLAGTGVAPVFPIWGMDTRVLAATMIESGLRARIACVDTGRLPAEFAGREFDAAFLADLPADVDPCGENGEFHSFAFDGPMFDEEIRIEVGESTTRDGHVLTDLLPA